MKGKLCIATLFALAMCSTASAQQYASIELSEIGELLQHSQMRYVEKRDRNGIVSHLGLPLLPQADDANLNLLFRFVERYDAERMMADDQVEMDVNKVVRLDASQDVSVSNTEQRITMMWEGAKMSFPNNYSLISGLNKAESDQAFIADLKQYASTNTKPDTLLPRIAAPADSSSYVVKKGTQYMIKEINSDKYYIKLRGDSICPIYSCDFPSETLANLMQQVTGGNFKLRISQNMYGYNRQEYEIPLRCFSDFCTETGCSTYVGIEAEDDKQVKAVVVYRNTMFAYNHLLYITGDNITLGKCKGTINAALYCYIPTHNVKSMYNEKNK